MILYKTAQQKIDAFEPDKLDFSTILMKRQLNLTAKERKNISLTEIGEEGELEAVRILKKFGKEHWVYLRNVWLDVNGRYESDLIVITNAGIYVFEVKNYDGIFTYENGNCRIDHYDLADNCLSQANRAFRKMEQICREASIHANVQGAILFIGEFNHVEIKSPTPDIEVITRSRFKRYIQKMVSDESSFQYAQVAMDKLMRQLDKHSITDPFRFAPLTNDAFKAIRTGICCSRCHSFDVVVSRKFIRCRCGIEESRDEAVIRTICEYGALKYDQSLRPFELLAFFNGQISKPNLYKIVDHYFERDNDKRIQTFINKKLPFERIADQFPIVQPKKLHLADESLIIYHYSKHNPFTFTK